MCRFCAGQRDLEGKLSFFHEPKYQSHLLSPFLTPKKLKRLPSVSFTLIKMELKDGPLIALF